MDGRFLESLAVVLCTAAVTTVLFQRLRQPVILGYLIAGLVVGPHVPIPLVADVHTVETLSELGVILLMFSLGLEFNLQKLARVAKTGGLVALIEVSLMVSIGYLAGRALGWSPTGSVFAGAVIAISSTTIIAKTFDEQKVDRSASDRVFGILVAEDLLAILLVTSLTAIASGAGVSAAMVGLTIGRLALFLVAVVALGLFIVPRIVRLVVRLGRPETTVIAAVGLSFALALFAKAVGYSVALGAFLAGSLASESGKGRTIEHLVQPLRDVFGAVFFVSVGMLIDPRIALEHWAAILAFTALVIGGKIAAVGIASFLSGASIREAVQAGMTLAQIGEFSFIIASVGLSLRAADPSLYPVAVLVSALTALTTPWLVRASPSAGELAERYAPKRIRVFATLYSAWLTELGRRPRADGFWATARRLALLLLVDAGLLVGIVVGTSLSIGATSRWLAQVVPGEAWISRGIVVVAALAASAPFVLGIVRCIRSLARLIVDEARGEAAEASRSLVVAAELGIGLVVGAPVLAVTSAFLPISTGIVLFGAVMAGLAVHFWRTTTNLPTAVRAGVHVVLDLLAEQRASTGDDTGDLEQAVHDAMPWFGSLQSLTIPAGSAAVGRTLAEINLRGRTGANVVAIHRAKETLIPSPDDALQAGDILAVTGSPKAIAAAVLVVSPPGSASDTQTEMALSRP